MQKFIFGVMVCVVTCFSSASAQDQQLSKPDRLERIGKQLFTDGSVDHYEYEACITDTHACYRINYDKADAPDHGPSLSETLDWIGDQLISNELVNLFEYQGCQVAIDIMEGSPTFLTWKEQQDGALKRQTRSILRPIHQGYVEARRYSSLGHITYLIKGRSNGTPDTPMRVSYHNDAVVMDLGMLRQIKNYAAPGDEGGLELYALPVGPVKFVYPRESHEVIYHAGMGFKDTGANLLERLVPFPEPENPKAMYGADYTLFDVSEPDDMLMLFHGPGDVDMNIKLTKAFMHAMDICSKTSQP